MNILKKENWWIWLLLMLFSNGTSTLVLGALLDVYDKNAWYTKWYYWVIGLLFIFPFFIMIYIFQIEILCKTCAKLEVPGKELYLSPYLWLLGVIIPFLGWGMLGVANLYLIIYSLISLHQGKGEQYIK